MEVFDLLVLPLLAIVLLEVVAAVMVLPILAAVLFEIIAPLVLAFLASVLLDCVAMLVSPVLAALVLGVVAPLVVPILIAVLLALLGQLSLTAIPSFLLIALLLLTDIVVEVLHRSGSSCAPPAPTESIQGTYPAQRLVASDLVRYRARICAFCVGSRRGIEYGLLHVPSRRRLSDRRP